jgi:hypothetical protein
MVNTLMPTAAPNSVVGRAEFRGVVTHDRITKVDAELPGGEIQLGTGAGRDGHAADTYGRAGTEGLVPRYLREIAGQYQAAGDAPVQGNGEGGLAVVQTVLDTEILALNCQ